MRRIHYAWIVAAVGLVTLITAAGFRSTTGVLIVPLQDEFGWSRATIGVAVAINLVLYGLGGPFSAALVERFGVRRVAIGALLGVSAGSSLTVLMTRTVAARPPLGRRQRARDRRDRDPARRDHREPLVRRAARPRDRRPHRVERDRAADLPAAAGGDRHALGLALRVGHRQPRRARRSCCRSSRSSCATAPPTSA